MEDWEYEAPKDRWLLSYADLVTLLLAFFVVMYSVSAVNEVKLSELAETLSASFQASPASMVEVQNPLEDVTDQEQPPLENEFEQHLASLPTYIDFESDLEKRFVTISLPGELLFDSGTSTLSEQGIRQLEQLVPMLAFVSGTVEVEGHTDNQPMSSARYPSNWELSAHRAAATVRILQDRGINPEQFRAVGLAASDPVSSNDTPLGRQLNRRVVLRLEQLDWQAYMAELATTPEPEPLSIDDIDPALLEEVLRDLERQGGG